MASSSRRFYWLKLPADFFDRFDIRYMMAQPDGNRAVLLYLKLLLRTISTGGELDMSGGGESLAANLALLFGEDLKVTEKTLSMLQNFKLAVNPEPGKLIFPELSEMVGSESESAGRMRKHRREKTEMMQTDDNKGEQSDAKVSHCSPVLHLSYV